MYEFNNMEEQQVLFDLFFGFEEAFDFSCDFILIS
jgi:hypothetical protein